MFMPQPFYLGYVCGYVSVLFLSEVTTHRWFQILVLVNNCNLIYYRIWWRKHIWWKFCRY
jgi:hypothetical protein